MIQGDTPNWEPLEELLGDDLPGWFMWMFEAKLVDGTVLHAYKHRETRNYIHLTLSGRAWDFWPPDSYIEADLRTVVDRAFDEWAKNQMSPEQMAVLDKVLEEAPW